MLELITLCHKDHEFDNPSCAELSFWMNKLFAIEFKGRDVLIKQIENSQYKLINGDGFISIRFYVNSEVEKFPFKVRVPVEMTAIQQKRHPIIFLLHVLDGIVDELEIYTSDSSLIDSKISVVNVSHRVAEPLKYLENIKDSI